jgi:ABC-type Fe3+ transport system permease subunit
MAITLYGKKTFTNRSSRMGDKMVKQGALLLVVSLLCIIFMTQLSSFLHSIEHTHHILTDNLATVFSGSSTGKYIKDTLSLILLPILIGLIPGGIYWAIKREKMPYLMPLIWVLWLMLTTTLILGGHLVDQPVPLDNSLFHT